MALDSLWNLYATSLPCLQKIYTPFSAYRIWQQTDGRRWWQRHEWRHADGTTHMEGWIEGAQHWCPDAAPEVEVAA